MKFHALVAEQRRAITEVILAAFPTASCMYPSLSDGEQNLHSAMPVTRQLQESTSGEVHLATMLRSESRNAYREGNVSLDARHSCFTDVGRSAQSSTVWQFLYERWCPPYSATPAAPARCSWLNRNQGLDEKESILPPRAPQWVADAVVFIGGFESPDVSKVIASKVFEHIPTFECIPLKGQETSYFLPGQTEKVASTANPGRRAPSYMRKSSSNDAELLKTRGCAVHSGEVMEISLPVRLRCKQGSNNTQTQYHRMRTFITFANPMVNVAVLLAETQSSRRAHLRGALGYSSFLLMEALPDPVTAAVAILSQWQHECGLERCSDAFWLSAVGHAIEQDSDGAAIESVWRDMLINSGLSRQEVFQIQAVLEQRDEIVVSVQLATRALCLLTARLLSRAEDARVWEATVSTNFFLPVERFDHCTDVEALAVSRHRLSLSTLQGIPVISRKK